MVSSPSLVKAAPAAEKISPTCREEQQRQVEAIRNSFNVYFNVIVKSVTYTKSNGALCTTAIPTHLVVQVYNSPLQTLTSFWQVKAPLFA